MRLLLAIFQSCAFVIFQQPVLSTVVAVAERAVAHYALRGVRAVFESTRLLFRCAATESQDKVQSRLFLYVVVRQCSSIFKLFSSEDQALLIGWDPLFILNLALDIIDGIG